jgi:hypothetical protein
VRKMKYATVMIAVLTVLLQMQTIAGRGPAQCTAQIDCGNNLCCSSKGLCGSTEDYCGAGCINGPCDGDKLHQAGRGGAQCTAQISCGGNLCCSSKGLCGSTSDYCGAGCISGPCYGDNLHHGLQDSSTKSTLEHSDESNNAANLVTAVLFDKVFPNRASLFTYDSFLAALNYYPMFGTTGTEVAQKREVAAFLAHFTSWTGGIVAQGSKTYSD